MSDLGKKIFEALIVILLFVQTAPVVLQSLFDWNLTSWPILDGVKDLMAIVFVIGLGVYGVAKLVGII